MRKVWAKFWPIIILAALSTLFFTKLFYPQSKIFVTPEFGMSDLWHQNLPSRFLLKEALSEGHLPLWTDKIGMGFPLFAEGQVAALSLINLVPTIFFSAVTSFNISFILIFLLLSISTFLFCREIGISKESALFSAIALTFSAKIITQLNHPNILLTFAFLPLSLFLIEKYRKEKKIIWLLVISFSLSQQILSGHLQMAFYCWIILGVFWVFSLKSLKKPKTLIPLGLLMLLAIGISSVQLLPSWEFMQNSNRAVGLVQGIDAFPFRLKHLALFLRPTIFGSPANATYPLNAAQEGLFWENSVYIGIIPLVLAVLAIFACISTFARAKLLQKASYKGFFVSLFFVSLLLALGRATPLFFIFKLPLMNFFRIPPRLLFLTVFSLVVLAGFGLDTLVRKLPKNFQFSSANWRVNFQLSPFVLLVFLTLLDLLGFGYNYHPIVAAKDWIESPPETAQYLQNQPEEFRIVDAGSDPLWNKIFWHYGWQDVLPKYKNLRNSLFTNSNVYYGIKNAGVYAGVQVRRIDEVFEVLKKEIGTGPEGQLTISKQGAKLLGAFNVRYFVTPIALNSNDFTLVFHAQPPLPAPAFAIFENKNFLPRARFVEKIAKVNDAKEATGTLRLSDFDPINTAVIEGEISKLIDVSTDAKVTSANFSDQKIEITYESPSKNYLLLADTYYPGWEVFIDKEKGELFPANLNSKLALVPQGTHKVEFVYRPDSVKVGSLVSLGSLFVWGVLLIKEKSQSAKLKSQIHNSNFKF